MRSTQETGVFSRLVRGVLLRPVPTLGVVLALTLISAAGVARLELRTDGAAIYPTHNRTVELTVLDRSIFRDPEQVIVLATVATGSPGFRSPEGLAHLVELHRSLQELPAVDARAVRSYVSLPDPDPELPLGQIRTFLDAVSVDRPEPAAMHQRLRREPIVSGLLLAEDERSAAFYVRPATGHSRTDLVTALEGWAAERTTARFELTLTGPVTAEVLLGRTVLQDLAWLVPLMVIVVAGLLFASLRSVGGVLVPLAAALVVLIWTLGAMGWCGVPITLVTTILPVVLMTMSVTDEIHLLEALDSRLATQVGATPTGSLPVALEAAMRDLARPIVLTSLTTSLGFLSFGTNTMAPIQHFGTFAALGILLAMLLTFSFVPALLLCMPTGWIRRIPPGRARRAAPLLHERLVIRHDGAAAALGCAILLAAAPGISRLHVQDAWTDNFDPESRLVAAERQFNTSFWGSYRFDIVLTAADADYFDTPAGMSLVEDVTALARHAPHVGGVQSYLDPLRVVGKLLGEDREPSDLPPPVARRALGMARALRSRVDLDHYLARDGFAARVRLFVNDPDYARGLLLDEYLSQRLPDVVGARDVQFHMSGELPSAIEVVRTIVTNQLRSIAWAIATLAVLLVWGLRGIARAALAMTPLLVALPVLLGGMGYTGVPLGIASSMFAALAAGVGVDFSLHLLHAYERERLTAPDHESAMGAALARSGRAIFWNVMVLSLGFLVLTASGLRPNHTLGILLSASMVACYAATLLFLPRLIRWQQERA